MNILVRKIHSAVSRAQVGLRHPKYRRIFNQLIAATRPPALQLSDANVHFVTELEREGYANLGKPFDESALIRLRDALKSKMCMDSWHPEKGCFKFNDTPLDTNNARILEPESIPEAMAVANNELVLAVVSQYLRCRPTIDNIYSWWSIAGRPAPIQEQFFHRDNPSVRFLKLFIYLTDVTADDGPHVFIKGSHQTDELLTVGRRFGDEEVTRATSNDRVMRFTGAFGTAFLEDTFGLHKGEVPIRSDRLIFQVTYCTLASPSSYWETRVGDIRQYDPYINRLMNRIGTP